MRRSLLGLALLAVAMSAVALQGCGQRILTSGLDLDDEFDRVFPSGCPSNSLLKTFPSMSRFYCQRTAEEFVKLVRKNREMGVSPKAYLLSKMVTEIYCVNAPSIFSSECVQPRPAVDRYILKVEGQAPGGEIRADFERVSVVLP